MQWHCLRHIHSTTRVNWLRMLPHIYNHVGFIKESEREHCNRREDISGYPSIRGGVRQTRRKGAKEYHSAAQRDLR